MRYDEKEELEATGEWLMRINDVGFSEELTYIPSYLSQVGVAPVDVVDRLDWLRDHGRIGSRARSVEASSVTVLERPKVVEVEAITAIVVEVELPKESNLVFDHDSFGPWEWVDIIDRQLENAIKVVFDPEPGLHLFNELASLTHPTKRGRGKRARASVKSVA